MVGYFGSMTPQTACDVAELGIREAIDELGRCVERLGTSADPWAMNLGILVTIAVALIAFVGVIVAAVVQHRIARADQLWKRMEWASQAAFSEDENTKMVGLLAFERLLDPESAKREGYRVTEFDVALMDEISQLALSDAQGGAE